MFHEHTPEMWEEGDKGRETTVVERRMRERRCLKDAKRRLKEEIKGRISPSSSHISSKSYPPSCCLK